MDFFVIVVSIGVLILLFSAAKKRCIRKHDDKDTNPHRDVDNKDTSELYEIAEELHAECEAAAHPKDLFVYRSFKRGLKHLSDGYTSQDLLDYYTGDNVGISWVALEALGKRKDDLDIMPQILSGLNVVSYWTRYFALRALEARCDRPLVGAVLVSLDESWMDSRAIRMLQEFIEHRLEAGEQATLGEGIRSLPEEKIAIIDKLLKKLPSTISEPLRSELQCWRETGVDIDFLKSVGHVWETDEGENGKVIISHGQLSRDVAALEAVLLNKPFRSTILVGESGVGKTTLLRVLAKNARDQGWVTFVAGGVEILSGQIFVGELEQRLQKLLQNIGNKRKVLWIIPDFNELLWAGRHQFQATGILEFIVPYIERCEISIIGETRPEGYERLIQSLPKLRSVVESYRIQPLSFQDTLRVAKEWTTCHSRMDAQPLLSDDLLQEASQLALQYLGDKALPGNLLEFLQLTNQNLAANDKAFQTITSDDLILTLSKLTGLPIKILDDRQGLDLKALRDFFQSHVLGQREAVDCLVERVAMIKAGLTDPKRPQGVFLFVGPTGTGKTEIAKTLAEFLFGSPDRMIRLDMSEFQTPETLDRLTGAKVQELSESTLINRIRNQPFSVVLLDEFEKAHPNVWDIFLQVFDDGRLTDIRGKTADFRHCIIILTSNLGANIPAGTSIGFGKNESGFTATTVDRAVNRVFRREFINRIDRVIVFRPLDRSVMREILHKELDLILCRRGLRSRNWAVEWDESAVDFLLNKGFTVDLGARPLKRAIERYLLSPLAMTIVNHQFPEGDQFLFVRADGNQITVEFIDPDAPLENEECGIVREETTESKGDHHIQTIVLDANGTPSELAFLRNRFERLKDLVESRDWQQKKDSALSQMSSPGFWDSSDQYSVPALVEYMDRITSGITTAGSLLRRLAGSSGDARTHFSRDLVKRLAQQIYLVDSACSGLEKNEPRDAFLLVEASRESARRVDLANEFAARIGNMYRLWASSRRMQLKILEETDDESKEPYRLLISVVGFAAFNILKPETGLHVLETPGDNKDRKRSFIRYKVRVRVAAQPDEPTGASLADFRDQGERAIAKLEGGKLTVVRRYREEPSPLVRDSVRGWRTGNLDQVLGGHFDLIL